VDINTAAESPLLCVSMLGEGHLVSYFPIPDLLLQEL
jgi:hypothetical protein